MVKATFSVLSEADKQLVLETEPRRLDGLDEDELLALFQRVRRARNRHTKNYRREAGGQVEADAARGLASKKARRSAARAEVFEDALARVSRRLATAAKASASELRATRLSQASGGGATKPSKQGAKGAKGKGKGSAKAKGAGLSGAAKKRRASTLATGKRRQAKRDAR